jgi:NADH:ubiquinone oxidoreductase subunit F (NADH-binding)
LKGAIAIAQEHGNVVTSSCGYDVKLPIAVHIAQGHGDLSTTCVENLGPLEGAIAIAQEQAAIGTGPIAGNNIKFPIAIHIAQGHSVCLTRI